jgi:hypothetical protein
MQIIEILKQDYQKFPNDQTYSIYAENVYFKDPMNQFRGIQRYQQMIGFIRTWFKELQLDLHDISQQEDAIATRWTLSWTTPLPWQPRISIPGRQRTKAELGGVNLFTYRLLGHFSSRCPQATPIARKNR